MTDPPTIDNPAAGRHASQPQPPPLARKWVRYILGFGVSVGIGLAPYLGRFNIPGFTPLLSLIPRSIQDTAIPLSAALMGVIAVVVQWYGGERVTNSWLRKKFRWTLAFVLLSFLALTVIHALVVVKVDYDGGKNSERFLIGFNRPNKPPCENVAPGECIKRLTFDVSAHESHWGDRQMSAARLSLILSYLLFMSSFGLIVGLLLLRDRALSTAGRSPRRRTKENAIKV